MKRLFTFGCSFTNYIWPTYADILGLEYDHYENWGRQGSSNQYILFSLNEMLANNVITPSDTIVVEYTNFNRYCEFKDGGWAHYSEQSREENDIISMVVRDMNYITAIERILSSLNCRHYSFPMVSITDKNHVVLDKKVKKTAIFKSVYKTYKNVITSLYPSFYNVIFNFDLYSRDDIVLKKTEIVPLIAFDQQVNENNIKYFHSDYNNIKGINWPDSDQIIKYDFSGVSDEISDEILFHFRDTLDVINQRKYTRLNHHLTPLEHLEYLQKIGEFNISQHQVDTATKWNYNLLNGIVDNSYLNHRNTIKKFSTKKDSNVSH